MHHPPQPTSPFTNAPLQHNNHQHSSPSGQQHAYNGYPYQYPYGSHYPGYPARQPSQDKPAAHTSSEHASPAKSAEGKEEGDAWEAAQHILKAINFGGLAQAGADAPRPGTASGPSAATDEELTAVLSALASAAAVSSAEPPRSTLTDDERASLQAQLALLAAQLTEIAEAEEEDVPPAPPVAPPAHQPTQAAPTATAPPPAVTSAQPQPHHPPSVQQQQAFYSYKFVCYLL